MVNRHLKKRGIRDALLLEAFLRVPRHEFVPAGLWEQAYADGPLPIGHGQTISQPYMVAVMTSLAELKPEHRVLEIGTGSGYQAAILAEIVSAVYTVERIPEIAERARQTLQRLGYANIHFGVADGTLGWTEAAPFDAIVVTAGAPEIPAPFLDQLALGGLVVVPIEAGHSQVLYRVKRTVKGFDKERGERCTFVPLIGKHGWERDPRTR